MVVLATLATVIASQAVISGTFSVTRQAVKLGMVLANTASDPVAVFGLPEHRILTIGSHVEF